MQNDPLEMRRECLGNIAAIALEVEKAAMEMNVNQVILRFDVLNSQIGLLNTIERLILHSRE